jgi:hypothetical protein
MRKTEDKVKERAGIARVHAALEFAAHGLTAETAAPRLRVRDATGARGPARRAGPGGACPWALWLALALAHAAGSPAGPSPAGARADVTVGAIRWDAWHAPVTNAEHGGPGGPVKAVERSLDPHRYRHRAPFFARVDEDDRLRIDGYTQAVMDREIAFAKAGGIDYWAFLLYDEGNCMSQGLSLYLSSAHRRDVGFCAIASPGTFGPPAKWPAGIGRVVRLMTEPGYQAVGDGRPLLYLFRIDETWLRSWGGPAEARRLVDTLRAAVRRAGRADPYLVLMQDGAARQAGSLAKALGIDAISDYARQGNAAGGSFTQLAAVAHAYWDECRASGAEVVPLVMAGWDRRPRVEHPVPWETWQEPGVGLERFYAMPTPAELADHLRDAMEWAAARSNPCPARTAIVYAWNEHDEGGWLCPTLGPDGRPDNSRLQAIAEMKGKRP